PLGAGRSRLCHRRALRVGRGRPAPSAPARSRPAALDPARALVRAAAARRRGRLDLPAQARARRDRRPRRADAAPHGLRHGRGGAHRRAGRDRLRPPAQHGGGPDGDGLGARRHLGPELPAGAAADPVLLGPARLVPGGGAKGLGEPALVYKHALKNAMIPTVTIIGISFAILIGGAIVVETVFNIPGLGRLIISAVLRRDYPVIQGVVLCIAGVYMLINLAVDLSYPLFDSRVRYQCASPLSPARRLPPAPRRAPSRRSPGAP